jgi:hypothetical protein
MVESLHGSTGQGTPKMPALRILVPVKRVIEYAVCGSNSCFCSIAFFAFPLWYLVPKVGARQREGVRRWKRKRKRRGADEENRSNPASKKRIQQLRPRA